MTPYMTGSNALRMEHTMDYNPINFKRMRLNPDVCQVRVLRDEKDNALFEVMCNGDPVMAFRYSNLRPWMLNQRRDAFSRLLDAGNRMAGMIYFSVMPTETVKELPSYPMWCIHSALGEAEFWSCEQLLISVSLAGTKETIIHIWDSSNAAIASFQITGYECEDEEVLDAATELRQLLHTPHPVRIESVWNHEKVICFYPSL